MHPDKVTRQPKMRLEDLPNIGPACAADLRLIGIDAPAQLMGQQPLTLYRALCDATGLRHDPCMIDVFMAAVSFMEGGPALPWWHFTAQRKRMLTEPANA